jgi:hypothetical protein
LRCTATSPFFFKLPTPAPLDRAPNPEGLGGDTAPAASGPRGWMMFTRVGQEATGTTMGTYRSLGGAGRPDARRQGHVGRQGGRGRGDGGQGQVTSRSPQSAQHCVNGGKGVTGQCCTTGWVVNQGCQSCATRESTCAEKQRPNSQRTNSIMPPPPCLQTRLPTMAQGQCSCVRPTVYGSGHSMGGGGGGTSTTWAGLRGRVRRRRRRW